MSVRATSVWAFNTGGSLRFIGDRGDLPNALQQLWMMVGKITREKITLPPVQLKSASQKELRDLLLDMMRGHGLSADDS